jgi:DNA-3-methyladenine glycosylase II
MLKEFEQAFEHLKKDEVMKTLIKKVGNEITLYDRTEKDLAKAIAQLIIEQQVSFKAAITIKKRFKKIIEKLSYKEILQIKNTDLQSIGITFRKVEYIKNIYTYFLNSTFDFYNENSKNVVKELIKIKGIGKWTAEMFLIFILYDLNVFSKGDLALINSIKINYGINEINDSMLNTITEKWSPYKTVASLLLWKSIEEKKFVIS